MYNSRPSPLQYHGHFVMPYFTDSDVHAADQPSHNDNFISGPGNSSISDDIVLPSSNTSGPDSYDVVQPPFEDFYDLVQPSSGDSFWYNEPSTPLWDPLWDPLLETIEVSVDGLNGMNNLTSVSTFEPTSELPLSVEETPNQSTQSSTQPGYSYISPPPSPPVDTQSSTVEFSPPPLNMTTPSTTPSSFSVPIPVLPQTGASTSNPSFQTASMALLQQLQLQFQGNPVVPQPVIQPQVGQDDPVVCVVCGGICKVTFVEDNSRVSTPEGTPSWMRPILVQAKPEYLEWQKRRPSIRAPGQGAELIKKIQVTALLGGSQGMKVGGKRLPINTMDQLMRIPIHEACLNIARMFCKDQLRYSINFRCASGGAPSSIAHFYEIWCKRAIASHPEGLIRSPILEANKYFGAPVYTKMADYRLAMWKDPSLSCFLAYPFAIPGLTDMVVNSNLETMDDKVTYARDELIGLLDRIQSLPQEVSDLVVAALEPFEEGGLPLQPTRVLPPGWWKKMLLSKKIIPWLWDLDEDEIFRHRTKIFYQDKPDEAARDRRRGTHVFDENMWDWELLCRQLAQANVMKEGGLLAGKSDQLWNRRRIWKLLDAARLGHLAFPTTPMP